MSFNKKYVIRELEDKETVENKVKEFDIKVQNLAENKQDIIIAGSGLTKKDLKTISLNPAYNDYLGGVKVPTNNNIINTTASTTAEGTLTVVPINLLSSDEQYLGAGNYSSIYRFQNNLYMETFDSSQNSYTSKAAFNSAFPKSTTKLLPSVNLNYLLNNETQYEQYEGYFSGYYSLKSIWSFSIPKTATDLNYAFYDCSSLTDVNFDNVDFPNVTTCIGTFMEANSNDLDGLSSATIENFFSKLNATAVTDMSYLFYATPIWDYLNNHNHTIDLSWLTNLESMDYAFSSWSSQQNGALDIILPPSCYTANNLVYDNNATSISISGSNLNLSCSDYESFGSSELQSLSLSVKYASGTLYLANAYNLTLDSSNFQGDFSSCNLVVSEYTYNRMDSDGYLSSFQNEFSSVSSSGGGGCGS